MIEQTIAKWHDVIRGKGDLDALLADDVEFISPIVSTPQKGKYVNGIDMITCNDEGKIVEFKVMIRPLQAINLIHKQMARMLEKMKEAG